VSVPDAADRTPALPDDIDDDDDEASEREELSGVCADEDEDEGEVEAEVEAVEARDARRLG
jgi:hypothetical protein